MSRNYVDEYDVAKKEREELRNRFAMATLVGLLASRDTALTLKETAALSFEIADAMMEARK